MDLLTSFFGRNGFLPHGYCFTWSPGLMWSMVSADALIALAYFSIPLAMIRFVRKRDIGRYQWVAWLFCGFIFACGITHLMDIWTIWQPDYALQMITKVMTAAISVLTATALWFLIPKALKIPSVTQLQSAISSLESEIRQRKSAETHLRDIEQSLAVTLGSIGAGFIATDEQGRVTRMNAVAERITGWLQDEARGHLMWDVFIQEGRPAEHQAMNPVEVMIAQCITVNTTLRVVAVSRDGTRTSLELQAAPMRNDDDEVCGLAMVLRDMTQQNRVEAELHRLAAIVESSNDAIISKTLDGRITSWNHAAQLLFGYTPEEAIGRSVRMLIPPDRVIEEMRILSNLAHGKNVPPFETIRRAKDGRDIEVSIAISPIRDEMGRIIGGSKIARDISQQRLAEEARLKAARLETENHQIQEANRLKSQFLANMSHELRTPLNAIIGFADLMHAGAVPESSPKHREFLGHIGTSGRHLLQLINDVLDLSKIESGKFEFFPEPVDLIKLIDEVSSVLHTSLQRKQLTLERDVDPTLGQLLIDPGRLKQVLYNYLSNAIKFTPDGGRVTLRARHEGPEHFRLEVEDTGIGMATADLPRLFADFQQLDAGHNKQHAGTGLGLALTRRLIEAQGGSVGVRSTLGVGSVFHVVLECRHTTPPDELAPTLRRLLMIENDRPLQAQVIQQLSHAGFRVDTASTGEQALVHARGNSYDALTLDLLLPDQHGLGALASIRRAGPSSESPVLAVTMPIDGGDTATFAIANVLSKPIRTQEIVSAMTHIRQARSGQIRVMVIDDEPSALDLMDVTLKQIGIHAICLQDGRLALSEIEQHRPDAIILDLMMPEFDGFAVLDALRRMPVWQHTPVFIWTSMILTEEEYANLARSARAILSKGGGALAEVMEAVSRWRPPMTKVPVGDRT